MGWSIALTGEHEMKSITLSAALVTAFAMAAPMAASAGNSYSGTAVPSSTCKPVNGRLCPPTKVREKIVPHYYNVPTKTKHIYYKQPPVKPITTKIIHHVPVPVYGGQVIVEKVQAGQWTGPNIGCCRQKNYCNQHQTHHKPRPSCR